jgi:phage terminase small subunit
MPFQKGKSGNPAGRPRKGRSQAELARESWDSEKRREAIAALADKARKGNANAIHQLAKLAGRKERVAVAEAAELTAARVLEEFRRLAFVDMRSFFDEHGNLKPIHELTPEQGSALAGLEVITTKNAEAGDGVTDRIHKFKVWDKTKPLDTLAKYFGLLKDDSHLTGDIVVRWASD